MRFSYLSVLLLFASSLLSVLAKGQDKIEAARMAIMAEGQGLYRSEMASWYGTDVFLESCKDRMPAAGGYFSYAYGDSARCIFFSKEKPVRTLGIISFDSTYKHMVLDTNMRLLTPYEQDLYTIRQSALNAVTSDTLFQRYQNTNFNLVPLITPKSKKVFVFTGPKENGVIILGGDYLLEYNPDNRETSRKKLHKSALFLQFNPKDTSAETTLHTHLPETGDFITSTDVCTLMLYGKYTGWKRHIVISENYVSLWDCTANRLVILTRKAWEKIYKN